MKKHILSLMVICASSMMCYAQEKMADPVLQALKSETDRAYKELKVEGQPSIYFLGVNVNEYRSTTVVAKFGKLIGKQNDELCTRSATTLMVLGDSLVASPLQISMRYNARGYNSGFPIGNDVTAMRINLWKRYDYSYKTALPSYAERTSRPKNYLSTLSEKQRLVKDWTVTPPVDTVLPLIEEKADLSAMETYAVTLSKALSGLDFLVDSKTLLSRVVNTRWYYNSDGTTLRIPRLEYNLLVTMEAFGENGLPVATTYIKSWFSGDDQPDEQTISAEIKELAMELKAMDDAKKQDGIEICTIMLEDAYVQDFLKSGTIIGNNNLERSLAVSPSYEYSTGKSAVRAVLENMKGRRIMSSDYTIKSLTGTPVYMGKKMGGCWEVDLLGTRTADSVTLVERGILKNMMTSRIPAMDYESSNGHFRPHLELTVGFGVMKIEINPQKLVPYDTMYDKLIEIASSKGQKYAYVGSGNQLIKRINTQTRHVEVMSRSNTIIDPPNLRSSGSIVAASMENYVSNSSGSSQTIIAPRAVIFDEMEIRPSEKFHAGYITPRSKPIVEMPR